MAYLEKPALLAPNVTKAEADYNNTAWSLLYKAILDGTGAAPTNFQLNYPFTSWNWPEVNLGFTSAAQYDFCATMPQWSATGQYVSSGARFSNGYQNFLGVIAANTTNPKLQMAIDNQQQKVQIAKNEYDTVETQAAKAYEKSVGGGNVPTFDAWMGTTAGRSWNLQREQKWAVYVQEQNNLTSLVNQAETPGLGAAMSRYANKDFYTQYEDPNLSNFPSVPGWSVSQSATKWRQMVEGGGGTGGQISFRNSDSAYDYKKTWAKGSASISRPFWSVAVGGQWNKIDSFETDENLSVTVEFKAWDQIGITAGGWYDGTFVSFHKNGPFIPGFGGYKGEARTYMWGEGGAFNLLKTGMYVCYQPTFSITVSKSSFESFSQDWGACTGISVGPFQFGGRVGQEENRWKKSTSGFTFSGVSESIIPLIFGVTINSLNNKP